MDDLIERSAAIEAFGEPHPLDYNRISAVEKIKGLPSVEPKERKTMTIKEFHEMCTASAERYIDRKTQIRFLLDYSEAVPDQDFSDSWVMYKKYCGCKVEAVWALVDHDGKPVIVVEYDSSKKPD